MEPRQSTYRSLIWVNPPAQSSRNRMLFLFRRGTQTPQYLCREDDQPGIVAWSLDHHVLSIPVYRGPHDDSSTYQAHGVMLDKYQGFLMPPHQAASDTISHSEGGNTPNTSSGAGKPLSFRKQWHLAHKHLCGSRVKLQHGWMKYRTMLTGNIIRAIDADHHSGLENRHTLSSVIIQNYDRLRDDHDRITESLPRGMMPPERLELFGAWDEAVKMRRPIDDSWEIMSVWWSLPHYPVQFTVEGAIMVTVRVSIVGLSSEAADILRDLAFFESPDSGSQPSDDSTVRLQLPLLLIKEQHKSHDDDGLDEADIPPQFSTRNEQRIATASAAWYLSRLGIEDFPVFGLVTCKEKGYLSQAWVSSTDKCCYVADWNIQNDPFDIRSDDGGLDRYNAFLSKLTDHGRELDGRFEGVRDHLLATAMSGEASTLRWSTRAQWEDYDIEEVQD